jgi:hypothetical protein
MGAMRHGSAKLAGDDKARRGRAGFVAGLDGEDGPQSDGPSVPARGLSVNGRAGQHMVMQRRAVRRSHPDRASGKTASGEPFLFRDVMRVTAFRGARF